MIGSSENRISYNGNGIATEFAYNFIIIEKSDIKVLHVAADGTEQLLTKDYYVDMEKSVVLYPGYAPGAEIPEQNRPPVLPIGERLVIYREVPITQDSALDKHWPFNVVENGLDKLTIICQQIWDRLQRSFYVSESTSTNFDPKVPIEAGKTFRVKDDGTGFEVTEDPGKVIDGATALLEQTIEQANIAVESSTNAQNAANAAEAVAPEYAKTKEVLDNIVSYTNTATEQANIATAKANAANVSATNAAQSYANADAVATQLTEYLATKESLTAPAVDKTLLIEGAAADSKVVGELKSDLINIDNVTTLKRLVNIEPAEVVDGVVWYKYSETKASYYSSSKYGHKKYFVSNLPSKIFISTFTNDSLLQFVFVDNDNNIILSYESENNRFGGFVDVPRDATILYINYSTIGVTTNFNPYGAQQNIPYDVRLKKEDVPTRIMTFDNEYDGYYTFESNTSKCVKFNDNADYKSYAKRVLAGDIVRLKSGYFAALAGYILTDNSGLPYFVKHTTSGGSATYDDIVTIEQDGFLYVTRYGTSSFYEQGDIYVTKEAVIKNSLNGKKIFFDGDSITMASGSGVVGYVKQIEIITGCITQNLAVDGGTLTSGTTIVGTGAARHHVCESILNSDADTDIYCISGGYNDFGIGQSDLGTYIEQLNSDLSLYDTTTLYGALDYIFTWLMINRSGKPILFIMTHNPLNYRVSGGSGKTANITLEEWFDAIKKMCKKYSVPYVNLFDEAPLMTKLDSLKQFTVNNDGVHPTTEGYKRYYVPKIISALYSICPIDFA